MRLKDIQIRGFIGAREIQLQPSAPVLIVCGDNEAGKTSVHEAINLAATGEMVRVKLKKDYGELVSDGLKTGLIAADFDAAGETLKSSFELPAGKWGENKRLSAAPAMQYCLNHQRFSALDETERRRFLFGLAGKKLSTEEVGRRLGERGVSAAIQQQVLPLLKEGFDKASKFAATQATQAKGAWRTITGETYGSTKAETWRIETPEFDVEAFDRTTAQLDEGRIALRKQEAERGRLQGLRDAAQRHGVRIFALQESVQGRDALVAQLRPLLDAVEIDTDAVTAAQAEVEAAQQAVAAATVKQVAAAKLPEPTALERRARHLVEELQALIGESEGVAGYHNNGAVAAWGEFDLVSDLHLFAAAFDEAFRPKPVPVPKPVPKALTDALAVAQTKLVAAGAALAKSKQRLAESELEARIAAVDRAAAELQTLEASQPVSPSDAEIAEVAGMIDRLSASIDGLAEKVEAEKQIASDVRTAVQRNTDAARWHAEVVAWDAVAKALAPDGIQAEIVAEALQPLNDSLALIAADSGWPPVTIDAEMTIRYGGRRYGLLSESGRWRADACLAVMIAMVSGIRFVMLDRIDVNSIPNRKRLLQLVATLVGGDHLDGAVLLGTLKAPPVGLPESIFESAWLEDGRNAASS